MPTEVLYADGVVAGNAFVSAANAVGSTTGNWAGELNLNSNYSGRWTLANPSAALEGNQVIEVMARKGSNSGTPNIAINTYVGGVLVASRAAVNVTSTVGQLISVTFTAAEMTPPVDAEIEVVQTSAGGSPSARNSAQIDYIRWTASLTAPTQDLVVQNASQGHTVESVALLQQHSLSVQAAIQSLVSDNQSLSQIHALLVNSSSHLHAASSPSLHEILNSDLLINNAAQAHAAQEPNLTELSELAIQNAAHGQFASGLVLTQDHFLAIANAAQAHIAQSPVVTTVFDLVIADTTHGQASTSLALVQIHLLDIDDATHEHLASTIGFPSGSPAMWLGSWEKPLWYIWNGVEWKQAVVKMWNGSSWELT